MKTITMNLNVPQEVAIKAGKSRYGDAALPLSDEQVASLSETEREVVLRYSKEEDPHRYCERLCVNEANWDQVILTIRSEVAKREAQKLTEEASKLEERAKSEKYILAALAAPDSEWWYWEYANRASYSNLREAEHNDPRIKERVARLTPIMLEARRAAKERSDREREERKAAEQAAIEVAENQLRAYAMETDSLARAARDGYEVKNAVIDAITEEVRDCDEVALDGIVIREGTAFWKRFGWSIREAPSAEAFRLFDTITAHVKNVRRPSCVDIEVEPIMRITVTGDDVDEEGIYTGVVVTISSPVTRQRAVVFSAE